ncbi:MAG: hypothetical protein LBM92_05855, partial [Opitutaceae bacterium]|nr:hypothetical protein [Opitutaceae bacterium]
MTVRARRRLALSALCLLAPGILPARAQPAPAVKVEDGVVELPAYKVTGKRVLPPLESWRYVSVPNMEVEYGKKLIYINGYEILSNLSGQNTIAFARELQLRQAAAAIFWPTLGAKRKQNRPIVLIDRNDDPWSEDTAWQPIAWEDTPGLAANVAASAFAPAAIDSFTNNPELAGLASDTLSPPDSTDAPPSATDVLAQADTDLYAQNSNPAIDGPASAKIHDGI